MCEMPLVTYTCGCKKYLEVEKCDAAVESGGACPNPSTPEFDMMKKCDDHQEQTNDEIGNIRHD
jgi:hypothetical protein